MGGSDCKIGVRPVLFGCFFSGLHNWEQEKSCKESCRVSGKFLTGAKLQKETAGSEQPFWGYQVAWTEALIHGANVSDGNTRRTDSPDARHALDNKQVAKIQIQLNLPTTMEGTKVCWGNGWGVQWVMSGPNGPLFSIAMAQCRGNP